MPPEIGCLVRITRSGAPALGLAAALFLGAAAGCDKGGSTRRDPDRTRQEGRAIFDQGDSAGDVTPWSTWSIVLSVFRPEERSRAQESLAWTRSVGGLVEARLERRSSGLVIAYGVYRGADDPQAQRDLVRLREMTIEGSRPYAGAILAPPTMEAASGRNPAWDLARVRAARGRDALYTLQIGVYGHADGRQASAQELTEFRRKAEQAVGELRSQGDEAYYYHAPHRSTVTVGVFGPTDYDPLNLPGFRSPSLARAWETHPYNLLNGQAIRERIPGTDQQRLQPSMLVRIPE